MFKAIGNKIAGLFSRKPPAPLIVHPRKLVTGTGSVVPPSPGEKAEAARIIANISNRNERMWKQFYDELSTYPIFLINCHSALCIDYAMCIGRGGRYPFFPPKHHQKYGRSQIPSFTVGPNTYIWSIAGAGEECYNTMFLDIAITDNIENFRRALTVTSLQDDIEKNPDSPYNVISNSMRATDCDYPNISATFVEDAEQIRIKGRNSMGVYHLKNAGMVLDNTLTDSSNAPGYCILNDTTNGPYGNKDWFLSDIIENVYSRGEFSDRKGIFILSGCAGPYRSFASAKTRDPSTRIQEHLKHVDEAETLIRLNNMEYSRKKPVMDIGNIRRYEGYAFTIKDAQLTKNPVDVHPNVAAGVEAATDEMHNLARAHWPPAASSVPHAGSHIEDDDV